MAFENIFERSTLKPCKKVAAALIRNFGIPRECLRAGLDATRSTPQHTTYAVFYDREAHQEMALRNEEGNRMIRAGDPHRIIPRPPFTDTVDGFLRGFFAR